MPTRPKLSVERMIELFHESASLADIAKREKLSARSLLAYWRNLQRQGRLPFERLFIEDIEPPAEKAAKPSRHPSDAPPPNDSDGRIKVTSNQWDEDLLLEELFEVHHAPPDKTEYVPALDLAPERYQRSGRQPIK
jgi:transposase-like protein